MAQISLPEHTLNKLRRAAKARGEKLSDLLDQIIEQYIEDERLHQIDQEQVKFEAQHSELMEHYAGQYVAMRAAFADDVVLITPVLAGARQTIMVRSPRVENNS
jgi:metal-responsive CopG/Arc/MetJ family transcriptional regulator